MSGAGDRSRTYDLRITNDLRVDSMVPLGGIEQGNQ